MEKTIKVIKEAGENLKSSILSAIKDFEIANPDVNINVKVERNYYANDGKPTHNVNYSISIK
ncbi:MAG: hypothetical protein [Bacteriophage sp.]|nr:MAG: hypothetical protein [Bacteriophage sp.]